MITMVVLCLLSLQMAATTTVLWSGKKVFASWSDVIHVAGSKFGQVEADDIVCFEIEAGSGAQIQVSYGSGWTNFEGLEHLGISGSYDMIVASGMVSQLKQGIHVKGVNYTLTAIKLLKRDQAYTTQNEELFGWDLLMESGSDKGDKCNISMKAYGGCGWVWPQGADFSQVRWVEVCFAAPLEQPLIIQVYDDKGGIKRVVAPIGSTEKLLAITGGMSVATCLSFISEKPQTIALQSVNVKDKSGNLITSDVESVSSDAWVVKSERYYDMNGRKMTDMQSGLNIVVTEYVTGQQRVKKQLINR